MPKFTIDHACSQTPEESYKLLKSYLEKDDDLKKLDSKLQCKFLDDSKSILAHGAQFKANIAVHANSGGSKIEVVVDLPLLLTPLKGKVQEILTKKLSKVLG
jgi:hypothetical protein